LQKGERWLVLGNMAELGADAPKLHAGIGRAARMAGIDRLYVVGKLAAEAASAFGSGARVFHEQAGLIAALRADLHAGVTALVKGSHSSHMENVVDALLGNKGDDRDAV
jgi:UDP-N-acetylmuramoyl-tripeptide--D-alanyl-D-alanine ligase